MTNPWYVYNKMYNAEHAMKTTYNDVGLSLEILQTKTTKSYSFALSWSEWYGNLWYFLFLFWFIDGQMTNGLIQNDSSYTMD